MENGYLVVSAFMLSLVDLCVLGAFLWYQFSRLYFAWHLCPMMVNRVCELLAFLLPGGMLPSLFAVVQVLLSLFSTVVYSNRHHLQSKLVLAIYCTLLLYEALVAILIIKMGRYVKCPQLQSHFQQGTSLSIEQVPQLYTDLHRFTLFPQSAIPKGIFASSLQLHEGSEVNGFVTVEQPDGKKVMLGKLLQPKLESVKAPESHGGGSQSCDGSVSMGSRCSKHPTPHFTYDVQV